MNRRFWCLVCVVCFGLLLWGCRIDVVEWAAMHRDELMEDWNRAMAKKPLVPIKPLDQE